MGDEELTTRIKWELFLCWQIINRASMVLRHDPIAKLMYATWQSKYARMYHRCRDAKCEFPGLWWKMKTFRYERHK